MKTVFVALLASFLAASCAEVRSDITVSHMLPAPAGKTVTIVPYEPSLASAPDYQGNVQKLAAHLQAGGYTVVPPMGGQASDYIAFFHYGIDGATSVNPYQSIVPPRTGSIITYGLVGPFSQATRTLYRRTVILEIVERARFRPNEPQTYIDARVYSGWVKSDGGCATMAPVIDPMLNALFAEFPGASGGVRRIDLPAETACGPNRFG